jgi:hypothetical protein
VEVQILDRSFGGRCIETRGFPRAGFLRASVVLGLAKDEVLRTKKRCELMSVATAEKIFLSEFGI